MKLDLPGLKLVLSHVSTDIQLHDTVSFATLVLNSNLYNAIK